MMTRVLTPNAEQGYLCGFAVSPGTAELDEDYLVLVAIPAKSGKTGHGKLEVYDPKDLKVLFCEPEVP